MKRDTDLFKLLMIFAITVACVPWSMFVMTVIWGWFVVPLGLPAIGKAHAFGLTLLLSLTRSYSEDDDKKSDLTAKITLAVGVPALVLLMGYIAHGLMR